MCIRYIYSHRKSLVPGSQMGEFYHAFKNELTPIPRKHCQISDKEKILPSSCYGASITLIATLGKTLKGKQNCKTKDQYFS